MYAFNLNDLIEGVSILYEDGVREECSEVEEQNSNKQVYICENAKVFLTLNKGALGISVESSKPLSPLFFADISLKVNPNKEVLSLTINPAVAEFYGLAFRYYNALAVDREPSAPMPSDKPSYPAKVDDLEHGELIRRIPCWMYPVIGFIPPYTVFTLFKLSGNYVAILSLSDGDATGYIWPKPRLRIFLGTSKTGVDNSYLYSIAVDDDPYEAIRKCVYTASRVSILKLRDWKKKPAFLNKLGWCSWNALLTEDLSHYNVVKIVKGLLKKGIPIKWVIIDDGWQNEVSKGREWFARVLKSLNADGKKFPYGLSGVVQELKSFGIELIGLWHTINIHWSGFEKVISDTFGVEAFKNPYIDAYVPHPEIDKAVDFYLKFFSWVKSQGFDFVKVDNQWVIHALYQGIYPVGRAARNIQLALQLSSYIKELDILNCMSMVPEDYSNYFLSNVMRVSIDYIPFWKADAKLHTIFSIYNALLLNLITYPDYDMWMTYDPYAKVHAVARVFSGGPIYITDRHPEKTDVNLVKMLTLDDGELVKVDEPGIVTRDALFRDPYNEAVLLKIAGRVGDCIALALFNVNREGIEIAEDVSLDVIPYKLTHKKYVFYKVFSKEKGVITENNRVKVKLRELDAEVIVLAPIENERAVIGLKEFMLPPYPIKVLRGLDEFYVIPKASGTLLYYSDGIFNEEYIEKNSVKIV
ncbi:MAG: Sip1-related alpha-galactosidase [Ignisphaera sp.]|uniref:Raffinose synthase n=1 Tax=Ignisphaera aggregans TaxID=334771 RepID=A0A7C4JJK2_9CREN